MVHAKPKPDKLPVIVIPSSADDRFRLGKVGLLAAVGLVTGLLWPRLFGVHLVTPPPKDGNSSSASAATPTSATAPIATELPSAAPETAASASKDAPPTLKPPRVTLAQVVSCRNKDGERESRCDTPSLDAIVQAPLQALIACDAADGIRGVLSLGFDVDFEAAKLDHLTVGRSTTLAPATAKQLLHCGEKELSRVSLQGVTHTKSSYRVFYKVDFNEQLPGSAAAANEPAGADSPTSAEVIAASGRVTVTWDAALVRAKPKDGEVLARVLGGTRLTVTGRQGDWYRVKYDAKGSEGWVYKSAIGL
jgi:hypothetical protein